MNDMYERRARLDGDLCAIASMLDMSEGVCDAVDYRRIRVAAANLAARAEVLEREYATVSRIISAIESRAKAEEVQVLQGAIQPDPTDAGSVQPVMCDPVSQG